ncbi:hypothetical protein SLS53_004174 [Cytospora paraplurivora]|uniref:Uncharacterized protein n=1 Tax=Cytospora paraplurivora TaxID=2898453 RepID=A0AAN9YHE0_9PEZI
MGWSRMTSSLFATTALGSFFVVALPHLLPCPAPRVTYADGEIVVDQDGKRRRRRRPTSQAQDAEAATKDGVVQLNNITQEDLGPRVPVMWRAGALGIADQAGSAEGDGDGANGRMRITATYRRGIRHQSSRLAWIDLRIDMGSRG